MNKSKRILSLIIATLLVASGCTRSCDPMDSKTKTLLNADQGFPFPPDFPLDPGEPGKKTLAGIDSDHDGIRDDVQRWIHARYPTDEKKRKALTQLARSYFVSISRDLSKEEMFDYLSQATKAIRCLSDRFGPGSPSTTEFDLTKAKVLNTYERTSLFLKNDGQLSGSTLGGNYPSDGTACE